MTKEMELASEYYNSTGTTLDEAAEMELEYLIQMDITQASGYYDLVGEVRVIDEGTETDEWYRSDFGAMSFFHTLCNGRKVHVRVCEGD